MKTIIYLTDFVDVVRAAALNRNELGYDYSVELIDKAIEAQVKDNLRYNIATGKTYNKSFGCISEPASRTDYVKYDSDSEAAEWSFTGYVRNSASRIKRGFSAI